MPFAAQTPSPSPIAWKGLGALLVCWAILQSCSSQSASESSPVSSQLLLDWLGVFWQASIGLVLLAGYVRPLGWLAAVATFFVDSAVFLISALGDHPQLYGIGPIVLHSWHGLVLSLVALGIALLYPPGRPELTKELRYLLPGGVRDRWLGPS